MTKNLTTIKVQGNGKLDDAVFEIYNSRGQVVETLTLNGTTTIGSALLPLDDYTVREKSASTGYLLATMPVTVSPTTQERTSQNTVSFRRNVTMPNTSIKAPIIINKMYKEADRQEELREQRRKQRKAIL